MLRHLLISFGILMFLIACETAEITNSQSFSGNGSISCNKQKCLGVGSYTSQSIGSTITPIINTLPFIASTKTDTLTCDARDIQLTLPQDISSPSLQSQLSSISCFTYKSQNRCLAVGYYTKMANTSNALAPLVMLSIDDGKSFVANNNMNGYLPANAEIGDEERVFLNTVTCAQKTCLIVGSYKKLNTSNVSQTPIILLSNDGGETFASILPTVFPDEMDQTDNTQASLNNISCTNNTCVAVGYYLKKNSPINSSYYAPLIFISNNRGQTFNQSGTVILPSDAGDAFATLQSVTCSKQNCVAVGTYQTLAQQIASNGQTPLTVYSIDGGKTFISSSIATPADGVAGFNLLHGVTCLENNVCITVGEYQKPLFTFAPLIARSINQGQEWPSIIKSTIPSSPPSGIPESAELFSIACASPFCVSVGGYKPNTNETRIPLAVLSTDDGLTFSSASTCTLPENADTSNEQAACFGGCPTS